MTRQDAVSVRTATSQASEKRNLASRLAFAAQDERSWKPYHYRTPSAGVCELLTSEPSMWTREPVGYRFEALKLYGIKVSSEIDLRR
jgi:hypothetical protein